MGEPSLAINGRAAPTTTVAIAMIKRLITILRISTSSSCFHNKVGIY